MNTTNTPAGGLIRIGLIELPDLAEALTRAGLHVVTGPDFRHAVVAIKDAFKGGAFPILSGDVEAAGLRAWLEQIQVVTANAGMDVTVAVLRTADKPVIVSDKVRELPCPTTLNTILGALKLAPLATGDVPYPEVAAAPEGMALPDFEDFEPAPVQQAPVQQAPVQQAPQPVADPAWESPAPAPQPVAAPVQYQPVQAPAPAPADDLFGLGAAPAPVQYDQPVQAPAPATAGDLFGLGAAPAPAAPVFVAPVFEEPAAPVFSPAPFEDPAPAAAGWGFRPAAAPAADEWATPAPAPVAAAPEADFDWTTPAPAPVAPAPVQQAPAPAAPESDYGWDTPAPAPQAPSAAGWDSAAPAAPQAPAPETGWDTPAQHQPAPAVQAPGIWQQAAAQQQTPEAPAPAPAPAQSRWETQPAPAILDDYRPPAPPAPEQAFEPAPVSSRMPASWTQQPQQYTDDASGVFDGFEESKVRGTGRSTSGLASMVIVFSGKGGAGKTTNSVQLAEIAAEAGLRVILIDGNSGQGDLRTCLRLNQTDLPTIYDAAVGEPRAAVLTPDMINEVRNQALGNVKFAFISAPPEELEEDVVTNDVYKKVIAYARRNADLVILDTQIIEARDRTGVVDGLIVPALVHDAWGVGVAEMSNVGVNNLNSRLRMLVNKGVPADRLMTLINKVPAEQADDAARAGAMMRTKSTYLGIGLFDDAIRNDMNAGRVAVSPTLAGPLNAALLRVTGNDAFRESAPVAALAPAKQGFFSRMFGRAA